MSDVGPYPFESADDLEITELDIENVDAVAERGVTVGQLVTEHESWRFGHVIVDEAQELTAMQWRMLMRRVRGGSVTVVGDLAQRTLPDTERSLSWSEVLPASLVDLERRDLTINYRSPAEINALASAVLAEISADLVPSRSVRSTGGAVEVVEGGEGVLGDTVERLLRDHEGQVAIISTAKSPIVHERVASLRPDEAKGLEFDAVVVVEPAAIVDLVGGLAHLYVALTRATRQLVLVHQRPLPPVLEAHLVADE